MLWQKWRRDILGSFMFLRKRRGNILSPLPGLYDTIPSEKDTSRLALSSDLYRDWITGYNPCQNRKNINKNLAQAQRERWTHCNGINHGRNRQTVLNLTVDPCAQLILVHDTIPSEGVIQ